MLFTISHIGDDILYSKNEKINLSIHNLPQSLYWDETVYVCGEEHRQQQEVFCTYLVTNLSGNLINVYE